MSDDGVIELFGSARRMSLVWPEPDINLATDDQVAPPAFPDTALPGSWSDWVAETAEAKGCPRDYVAANLLVGTSAFLGNTRRVAATFEWIEPSHLWAAGVEPPSSGKTPAATPVIDAAKAVERETDPHWRDELARYERDTEVATEKWQKEIKDAVAKKLAAPDRPKQAAPPEPPRRPRMIANDTTAEELMAMLAGNPRGLLLVRDELAGWLGSFGRYNNGGGADRGFYLETWNGGSFTTDRVKFSGKPIDIRFASLAIAGGIVPDRLREALAGADDGLAARFIWVWPDAPPYRPLRVTADERDAAKRDKLGQAVRRLRALTFEHDVQLGPMPRILPLADDARSI